MSADTLRMVYGSPTLQANGLLRVPADFDRTVWQQLLQMLESRMFRGELLVVDATHTHPRSFSNYQQMAAKHRYQVVCVDFSLVPFEVCQERNAARPEHKVVPPLEMERMYDNMNRTRLPRWLQTIQPKELHNYLQTEPKNVSAYKAIHHIGDIQGCFDPIREYFETQGIHEDELYVFVGDYLDRGTQNAAVMEWLLDNYHRPNFVFVEGNHEAHLRNWTRGSKARSTQFNQATAVELEAAGISPKKVYGFLYKLREMFFYSYSDKVVLVTHGGLSTLPQNLDYINSVQLVKGSGLYEEADLSDASFVRTTAANVYQVHGHRNRASSPTQVNERCFNLEGKVEFGGELRVVVLDETGFREQSVKSHIDATQTIIESVGDLPSAAATDVSSLVQQLRASGDIYEKPQDGTNISSFNFKRDVFYKKTWDSLNVHARGLFVNTHAEVIVARAYEKFFNVGERPETQPDALLGALRYPVRAWVKENGYLGLVGFDPERDVLVFASKSSLTSEFAQWLQQQFDQLVPLGTPAREQITAYLRSDNGKTLVFEVVEPVHDPHIINYDRPALILLDIVHNTVVFQTAKAIERAKIAKLIGCKVKQQARLIADAPALQAWLAELKSFDYRYNDENIEGFVLEDSDGFMVKVKLPWYAFWRQMRTQLEKLQSGKKTQAPSLEINRDLAAAFLEFMNQKSADEIRETNILTLRDEFLRTIT